MKKIFIRGALLFLTSIPMNKGALKPYFIRFFSKLFAAGKMLLFSIIWNTAL